MYFECLVAAWKSTDGHVGYVDSDDASDLDKRRSLHSYIFTIGGCAILVENHFSRLLNETKTLGFVKSWANSFPNEDASHSTNPSLIDQGLGVVSIHMLARIL